MKLDLYNWKNIYEQKSNEAEWKLIVMNKNTPNIDGAGWKKSWKISLYVFGWRNSFAIFKRRQKLVKQWEKSEKKVKSKFAGGNFFVAKKGWNENRRELWKVHLNGGVKTFWRLRCELESFLVHPYRQQCSPHLQHVHLNTQNWMTHGKVNKTFMVTHSLSALSPRCKAPFNLDHT